MKYQDWAPTEIDPKGHGLPERQEWLVVPVTRTRDSELLDESNFETALRMLGGKSDTVEVHRFEHWGPGWIEIILVHPHCAAEVEKIGASLERYPALDEDDLVGRQHDEVYDQWAGGRAHRIELCKRSGISIFAARYDDVPDRVFDCLLGNDEEVESARRGPKAKP